jgi:hypothetical protein
MMGYRSTGAMWFSQQALDAISDEQNKLIQQDIENGSFTHVRETEDGIILEFESWKWYDSYKDIQEYEAIFNMLQGAEIPYDFVRLGEDPSDVECREHVKFQILTSYEVV